MHFTGKILDVNKKKKKFCYFLIKLTLPLKHILRMAMGWVCKKFPISYLLWVKLQNLSTKKFNHVNYEEKKTKTNK